MQAHLDELAAGDLYRRLRVMDSPPGPRIMLEGREWLAFASNDYLCLANDPQVRQAAVDAIGRWGVGAGASRLINGTSRPHADLESALAAFKKTEAALVASTGWMANHVAIAALAGNGDLILCDKLNHASILDAARSCGAVMRTFPHGDLSRLEKLLARERSRFRRCLIITDSLFSMDGDLADLVGMADLKRRYDALLMIDEAHATGVFGAGGRGAAEHLDMEADVDVTVGTLSKALGGLGGFVAGPRVLIETIINAGRAFIYTTALPPALCAAAMKAMELVQSQPQRRVHLLELAQRFRRQLKELGLDTGPSCSQIIPIVLGSAADALAASRQLAQQGFLILAVRPPTVPPNSSRLRVSLCSGHTDDDLAALTQALQKINPSRR